uniref:Synaptobrevin, longin-like domain protein n=1 Tax=Tanacetum cinerariifolium TaxID=118510 RepID=A0A6L2L0F1_TANCI|nr:hypothetical protein [Tanacetum cinerariifolium]
MVAILEKTEHNTNFHQIVDFLEASHIRYALTVRPTAYVSHIRQFLSITRVETMDGETKILAKVNGRQRTVSGSSIRRHLKLNDEEGISTLPDNELFENLSLMGYNILPNQSNIATAIVCLATNRTYNFSKMIFNGMMRNVKDDTAFPTGDARYGEAFPTVTSLNAGQDKENIAKTSAMPYDASPRVTSLSGDEGKERMIFLRGCSKHGGMDQGEDLLFGDIVKDSDKSADKRSDSTDDMSNVLGTFGAANILANGGFRSVFTTTSLSVASASTVVSPVVATASRSFPTAAIFTTANVTTPTTRVTRSSRGVVIESSSLISVNIPSISKKDKRKGKMREPEQPSKEKVLEQMSARLARDLEAKFAQEDQIIREQAERDYEIAKNHAERELETMIAELDRSNEIVAKYLSEYEQAEAGLSHDEKVKVIDELLTYQRNLAQIKKYQAWQNKPAIKTERRDFYMSILRSNAGWKVKDFKGMTF